MTRFNTTLIVWISVLFTESLMGCATQKDYTATGFLDRYPVFEKGAGNIDLRYMDKQVDFRNYNRIMMDEVTFFFHSEADYKGIQPSEIAELGKAFHKTFVEVLGNRLTNKPGPNVARMRLAVTNIQPSSPVAGTMTTVVPAGLAISLVKKGATGEYTGIGSASMEVEFLDSVSNRRIAAAIDHAPGGKLDVGKLSPVKTAFRYWANRLDNFLREHD